MWQIFMDRSRYVLLSVKVIYIICMSNILNVCFGCSKEPSHRDVSFEYTQPIFRSVMSLCNHLAQVQSKKAIWNDWTVWTGNQTNNKIGIMVLYHIILWWLYPWRRWFWDFSIFLPTVFSLLHFYFTSADFLQHWPFRYTTRVSNSLDPVLVRRFVGLDLGQNSLKKY